MPADRPVQLVLPGLEGLTSDNTHLSVPTQTASHPWNIAWVCKSAADSGAATCSSIAPGSAAERRIIGNAKLGVAEYVTAAISPNTRRAYQTDLAHFVAWGGSIPATGEAVAAYLADHAGVLSIATLKRRLASIGRAHGLAGLGNPVTLALVRTTFRGIRRIHGRPQDQAAPLTAELLREIVSRLGDELKAARDRALLLVGFAGGFRRSELVAIDVQHLEFSRRGIVITLARSKTDSYGTGRRVGIPMVRGPACPVRAALDWIERAGIAEGPIFRPINRHGAISSIRLSASAVSTVVKDAVKAIGLAPGRFSGHSLRAGFITSAVLAGVSTATIREHTGHSSESTLARYVRPEALFSTALAAELLCPQPSSGVSR